MTEDRFKSFVDAASRAIDATGVIVLIVGLAALMSGKADDRAYKAYRQRVGRTILLALEFLVASPRTSFARWRSPRRSAA